MAEGPPAASPGVPPDARRVTVAFDRLPGWLDGVAARHGPVRWARGEADRIDGTAQDGTRVWIDVPYPPLDAGVGVGQDANDGATDIADGQDAGAGAGDLIGAVLAHVARPRRIGLILVRRGGFGVAVFDGTTLLASKVGSSYVQGTTKAGGWSQQRFARRRDNQARSAFGKAADEAARVVLPEAGTLDAVVCGGDHPAIDAVLADPRLAPLRSRRGGPWLAVPDPRRAVVESAPPKFLAATVRIHP